MKAMILTAGQGMRMRPLTATTPKPFLKLAGKPIIVYLIEQLASAGISDIIINLSYGVEIAKSELGFGEKWGVRIFYSMEPENGLETGGGIFNAMPLLGEEPFLVVSGDLYAKFDFKRFISKPLKHLANLVMVKKPEFEPKNDFGFDDDFICLDKPSHTFGGISLLNPKLFIDADPGFFPLQKVLLPAIRAKEVTGEIFEGTWFNIGTEDILETVEDFLQVNEV